MKNITSANDFQRIEQDVEFVEEDPLEDELINLNEEDLFKVGPSVIGNFVTILERLTHRICTNVACC